MEKDHKGLILVAGILSILAGLVAFLVPAVASVGTAIFIGWILIFASGIVLVDAFSGSTFARTAFRVVLAVVTFGAGLYLLVAPLRGTYTLTVMLVLWFVATGFTRIIVGIAEHGEPGWGLTIINGALSLILGILIARRLPESSDWAIGLLVGIDLLFYGVTLVASWSALRNAGTVPRAPAPTPRAT